jgi:hypothetical protein
MALSPAPAPMLAHPASATSAVQDSTTARVAWSGSDPSLGLPGAGPILITEIAAANAGGHANSTRGDTTQGEVSAVLAVAPSPSVVIVAPASAGGSDSQSCGTEQDPCATLRYAVNVIGNAIQPLTALVSVVLGPGVYGSDSCGANATRPMNISGAGSGVTRIDCQGTGRALVTSDSLWLTGLAVTGGFVNVSVVVPESEAYFLFAAGGGGGVAVMWPTVGAGLLLDVWDVAFENNSVAGVVTGGNLAVPVLGGGGLYIAGGGNSSVVAMRSCSFVSNTVSVADKTGNAAACGGGACVCVGLASSFDPLNATSTSIVGAVFDGSDVFVTDNVVSCSLGCDSGTWCAHAHLRLCLASLP